MITNSVRLMFFNQIRTIPQTYKRSFLATQTNRGLPVLNDNILYILSWYMRQRWSERLFLFIVWCTNIVYCWKINEWKKYSIDPFLVLRQTKKITMDRVLYIEMSNPHCALLWAMCDKPRKTSPYNSCQYIFLIVIPLSFNNLWWHWPIIILLNVFRNWYIMRSFRIRF